MLCGEKVQDHTLTLAEARALFVAVIEKYPTIDHRLSSSATIVHCSIFENAVVNLQMNEASQLDATEKQGLSGLRLG